MYGSLPYLYLSVAMVFITMMICAFIFHIQLTQYGMIEAAHQEGVGYSWSGGNLSFYVHALAIFIAP